MARREEPDCRLLSAECICLVRTLMQEEGRCEKLCAKHTHGTKEWLDAALALSVFQYNLAGVLAEQVTLKHPTGAQGWCIGVWDPPSVIVCVSCGSAPRRLGQKQVPTAGQDKVGFVVLINSVSHHFREYGAAQQSGVVNVNR